MKLKHLILSILFMIVAFDGQGGEYVHTKTALKFPDSIGSSKLYNVTELQNAQAECGCGTVITYINKSATVSIYVYDDNQSNIPNGAQSEILNKHFDNLLKELAEAHKIEDVSQLVPSSGKIGDSYECLQMRFSIMVEGKARASRLYLTGFENNFIKVRITFYGGEDEGLSLSIERGIGEILKAVNVKNKP